MGVKCSITTNQLWICLQHGSYELPLLWRETPVKVSCPVSHVQSQSNGPLSVCCSTHSMSVTVQGTAMELLRVNGKNDYHPRTPSSKLMLYKCLFLMVFFCFTAVRGQWTPLVELVEPCGFTLDGQDGELNIAAPLVTCGIAVMVNFRESLVMTHVFHYSCSAF